MSDFKASLPVKTEAVDGSDFQLQIADGAGGGDLAGVDSNKDLCTKAKLTDSAGTPIDGSNPLPVITELGACNEDYNTVAAVAAAATSDHDFAPGVAGKVVGLIVSASGCAKWELQTGVAASETTKAVFFTTAAEPSKCISLPCGFTVGAGDNVKLIRTNRDESAMDVYSTLLIADD